MRLEQVENDVFQLSAVCSLYILGCLQLFDRFFVSSDGGSMQDLVRYMDMGPMEGKPIGFPPQKRPRESTETSDSSKGDIFPGRPPVMRILVHLTDGRYYTGTMCKADMHFKASVILSCS